MLDNLSRNLLRSCRTYSFQNFYRTAFTSFAEEMDQIIDEQKSLRKDQAAKRLDKRKAKQERYNGKIKKRDWVQETEEERKIRLEKLAESGEVFERIKRKKAAVLLGYSGVNYYGMQKNPFVPTIEDEILKAMVKHKWITEDCYEQPQNAGFQRCARTDKGVSAARQLISLKIPDEVNIEEINKDLPEDIRIFGTFKVTKGFNAKSNCDARSYSYTLPTYTFLNEDSDEVEKSMYRMSPEKIEELNKILAIYEGTKNYHNFTLKKEAWDPSAKRYMISFVSDPPFVPDDSEIEFIRLKVQGQSFMLHQIRRMVGLVIAIMRGKVNFDFFEKAFSKEKYLIPQAPGLGLVLNNVHFTRYDNRYGNDGHHHPLTFEAQEEEVEKFFRSKILPTIITTELKDLSMQRWLGRRLANHNFEVNAKEDPSSEKEDDGEDDDE